VLSTDDGGFFKTVTEAAGLSGLYYVKPALLSTYYPGKAKMSGGLAVGDFDNDGWEDIFFARFDNTSVLLRNVNGTFVDVTPPIFQTLAASGAAW
jgi:hypothetical protein